MNRDSINLQIDGLSKANQELSKENRHLCEENKRLNQWLEDIFHSRTWKTVEALQGIKQIFSQGKNCEAKDLRHNLKTPDKEDTTEDLKENGDKVDILRKVSELYPYAQITSAGCVTLLSQLFFKYDGTEFYSGGAERYLLDLDEVCRELNVKFRIYQWADFNWVRFYNNVEVIGVSVTGTDIRKDFIKSIIACDRKYQNEEARHAALRIYSPFYIHSDEKPMDTVKSIGISHGIAWDSEWNHFNNGSAFWSANQQIISSASHFDKIISVDTNTCNWFQTIDYSFGRKISYVPNYVDNTIFHPVNKNNLEKIIITYPRRLYAPRGLYMALDAVDTILAKYPNVEFRFIGKGFEMDLKKINEKIAKWGNRVKCYSLAPNKMHEAYEESDITLIPTLFSEGTSLSCLEALSSGNAVIATRIGGLTDLILDEFNGILIEPHSDDLLKALEWMLNNPDKLNYLKKNAQETALAFSKEKWKNKWKSIVRNNMKNELLSPYKYERKVLINVKNADNVLSDSVLSVAQEHLKSGEYVYIASSLGRELFKYSMKRLQFISFNEDLYFKPDLIIEI